MNPSRPRGSSRQEIDFLNATPVRFEELGLPRQHNVRMTCRLQVYEQLTWLSHCQVQATRPPQMLFVKNLGVIQQDAVGIRLRSIAIISIRPWSRTYMILNVCTVYMKKVGTLGLSCKTHSQGNCLKSVRPPPLSTTPTRRSRAQLLPRRSKLLLKVRRQIKGRTRWPAARR